MFNRKNIFTYFMVLSLSAAALSGTTSFSELSFSIWLKYEMDDAQKKSWHYDFKDHIRDGNIIAIRLTKENFYNHGDETVNLQSEPEKLEKKLADVLKKTHTPFVKHRYRIKLKNPTQYKGKVQFNSKEFGKDNNTIDVIIERIYKGYTMWEWVRNGFFAVLLIVGLISLKGLVFSNQKESKPKPKKRKEKKKNK